jgi:cell division protein FtsB
MRRQTIFWLLPLAALVALFAVYFPRKFIQLRSIESQLRKIRADVAELQNRQTAMTKEHEFLKTDDGLEFLARSKLGYVKANEKKFIIETTPSPRPSATRRSP